jgi:hypothetical protein
MPEYLVSYDLKATTPDPHKPFLDAAEPEGLLYVFQGTTDVFRLPNTTLWGVFGTIDAAKSAFDRAKATAEKKIGKSVTVEKRIITRLEDWSIKSDKRKAADPKLTASTKLERCRKHQLQDPYFK